MLIVLVAVGASGISQMKLGVGVTAILEKGSTGYKVYEQEFGNFSMMPWLLSFKDSVTKDLQDHSKTEAMQQKLYDIVKDFEDFDYVGKIGVSLHFQAKMTAWWLYTTYVQAKTYHPLTLVETAGGGMISHPCTPDATTKILKVPTAYQGVLNFFNCTLLWMTTDATSGLYLPSMKFVDVKDGEGVESGTSDKD